MAVIYKHVSKNGEFIAFWLNAGNEIVIFSESFGKHNIEKIPIDVQEVGENDFEAVCNIVEAHYGKNFFLYGHGFEKSNVRVSRVPIGFFFPRIWRGCFGSGLNYNPIKPYEYGSKFHESDIAATSLFNTFFDIFRYVEPRVSNFGAFGHKIRELLILTCTEIEASFRSILRENSSAYENSNIFSTMDFIKLVTPLHLREWELHSRFLPDAGTISPFHTWSEDRPTKSLPWYDAYNAVKHDREKHFRSATLGNLVNAMAALHIVQISQWGPDIYAIFNQDKSPFDVAAMPDFVDEIYVPSDGPLLPVKYFDHMATDCAGVPSS